MAATTTTTTTQPPGNNLSAQIDLLISLQLWSWPALTLAIQNAWGGSPQVSRDKRDWLAGAVSELVTSEPAQLHDVSDLEEVLLQVMVDEFEVVVDDGSAEETAGKIWKGIERLRAGDVSEVQDLYQRWLQRQEKTGAGGGGGGGEPKVNIVKGQDQDAEDTDWDDDDDDDNDEEEEWGGFADNKNGDVDVDMGDAPPLLPKQKAEPEMDEDGFTKVVGKKKNRR